MLQKGNPIKIDDLWCPHLWTPPAPAALHALPCDHETGQWRRDLVRDPAGITPSPGQRPWNMQKKNNKQQQNVGWTCTFLGKNMLYIYTYAHMYILYT